MSAPLDNRLDRVEGRRMVAAADDDLAAVRSTSDAGAAMAAVIRSVLARAGVDAADAIRLGFADEPGIPPVAIPVGAIPETAELQGEEAKGAPLTSADDSPRDDSPWADDFESKILAMARRFADGQRPDFANSSFAELFAWSLAQPAAE